MSDVTFPETGDLTPGFTWTNPATGVEYTWNGDRWIIVDTSEGIDLQGVLINGNVATLGAEFGGAVIVKAEDRAGDGDPLFAITGDQANDGTGDNLLVARHHEAQGDQVRYYGPVVNNKEVTTKEYVDSNTDLDSVLSNGNTSSRSASIGGLTNQGNALFKFGSGQGVVLDSGSSYEPMLGLRSYSGPNQRKDVLIVRANGNAELLGKLNLAPGEADNEAVTYGQLATVAEEIEQIVPAYERGKYNFSSTDISTGSSDRGKYTLLRLNTSSDNNAAKRECEDQRNLCNRIPDKDPIECEIEYNACVARLPAPGTIEIVTTSFSDVEKIKFSKYDADGAKHEWTDVAVGQLIDIFNDADDNYFVGEITDIDNSNANLVLLTVNKVQAKGSPAGPARIKVFTLNNEIDELTNYVRKTGDQMTGTLETTGRILIRPGDQGAKGGNNMLVVNQQSSKGQASIFRVQQDGADIIKVQYDRTTTFNNYRITEVGDPTDGEDAVNRKWVEDYVAANVRRLWKWTGDQSSTPGEGNFSWAQSGAGYCYFDHRPFIGSELYCSGNQYFCKGGDGLAPDKEMGFAFMTLWEWTGSRFEPVKSGHLSASGVRTGKNNEPWRFSVDKNSILKLKDMTKDSLYAICIAGTVLT